MADSTIPVDQFEAFNDDRTPGERKLILDRLVGNGWTRRMVFDLLVACEWDEATARAVMEGKANG